MTELIVRAGAGAALRHRMSERIAKLRAADPLSPITRLIGFSPRSLLLERRIVGGSGTASPVLP